jgi:hypothetical protein
MGRQFRGIKMSNIKGITMPLTPTLLPVSTSGDLDHQYGYGQTDPSARVGHGGLSRCNAEPYC